MFSILRGTRPVSSHFQIQRLFLCNGLLTRSVRVFPKLSTGSQKFKFRTRYNIPTKTRILNQEFHTTNRRDIPPLLALILQPALRVGAFIFGRTLKKWWRKKDAREREGYAAWFRKNKRYIYGIIGAILSIFPIYYVTHIEITPITNRRQFIMFTKKQQEAFAKILLKMHLEQYEGHVLPENHPIYSQLQAVANRLLNPNTDLEFIAETEWSLTVVDLPLRNAFVLPGGNIFLFTGILQMVENADQLAFILAHEISHALLKHTMEQASNGFLISLLLVIPVVTIWAIFPDLVAGLLQLVGEYFFTILHNLPYSRALETEADEVGLTLAAKACVDVREAVVFWGLMRSLKDLNEESVELPTWLSTHPNHEDREKNLDGLMSKTIALRNVSQCPKLDAIDPRKKFYERSPKEIKERFKQRGVL